MLPCLCKHKRCEEGGQCTLCTFQLDLRYAMSGPATCRDSSLRADSESIFSCMALRSLARACSNLRCSSFNVCSERVPKSSVMHCNCCSRVPSSSMNALGMSMCSVILIMLCPMSSICRVKADWAISSRSCIAWTLLSISMSIF